MPNPFFKFKQFTIQQDQCAMKVCTDACILGAWFSAKIPEFSAVLDIGSGTGLLMMMLAQRSHAEIHGIEIEEQVAKHSKMLTLEELISVIDKNLQPFGAFGILLPYHRWEYFDKLAQASGFYPTEKLFVQQSLRHSRFRAILHYSRSRENFAPSYDLVIQKDDGAYTDEFTELMKDYYLYL
jgi:tRNA1Val (adenine37-N6)-methyltransferase